MQDKFPETKKEIVEEPIRKELTEGLSYKTAYIIKHDRETKQILESIFGSKDGDYFLISSLQVHKENKPYDTILVADKYGFKYQLWFEVSYKSLFYSY